MTLSITSSPQAVLLPLMPVGVEILGASSLDFMATRASIATHFATVDFASNSSRSAARTWSRGVIFAISPEIDPVFAALYWADWSNPQAGAALLNQGTIGYRWDDKERRVSNILATGRLGEMTMRVGLLPHEGGWLEGSVHQAGLGFGHPLYCVYEPSHTGTLPRQWQLCRIQPDTVTVSSVFCARGKSYLRLYEHAGRSAPLQIDRPDGGLVTRPVNLRLEPIDRERAVRPYQIATWELDG